MTGPLPRNEYGTIDTGARYGDAWAVQIEWNTDFDGRPIDPEKEEYAKTFHGTFNTEEEAVQWMNDYPDDMTDMHDMTLMVINRVRPARQCEDCGNANSEPGMYCLACQEKHARENAALIPHVENEERLTWQDLGWRNPPNRDNPIEKESNETREGS